MALSVGACMSILPTEVSVFSLLQIMKEIHDNNIQLYEFPECDDEEENRLNKKLKVP